MRLCWNILAAVLLLSSVTSGLRPPRSYYRRSYYRSVGPPGPLRLVSSPPSYREDLQTNESKHRAVSKKYPKKSSYRPYTSEEDEYSNERYSSEYSGESVGQDSREYTIGTQIRVQHPITVPKKTSYSKQPKYVTPIPYKSSGRQVYSSDSGSGEEHPPRPPVSKRSKWTQTHFDSEPDPFHLVPPPKTTAPSAPHSYSVFEPDHDDYEVPTRPKSHDRYKNVASKKQIEAFLEDQQKLLDEAIKLQLISNPKLHKYLKPNSQEVRPDLDIEDFETFPPNFSGPGPLHNNFSGEQGLQPPPKNGRPHRRPPGKELKRSPKAKHILKPKRKYPSSALVINV